MNNLFLISPSDSKISISLSILDITTLSINKSILFDNASVRPENCGGNGFFHSASPKEGNDS
jgi:hypothetical protein